jgi:HAD superfamily hydrolase (TIGR01549 family)
MIDVVIFDVDGTLIDTNYQHAHAWYRAFRRFDLTLPIWRIHRAIGMGGDQLVGAVAGDEIEERHGDALRAAWEDEYTPFLSEVRPFEGAQALLEAVRERGVSVVLASSGSREHVEGYLDMIDGRSLAQAWTTSEDAEKTKPAPDIVKVAFDRVDGSTALMVGDSTWDAIAAGKLGIATAAVRTGGFSTDELREAGAHEVFDSLVELRAHLGALLD